jgi:flagellar L-ring protein precursor FlgH
MRPTLLPAALVPSRLSIEVTLVWLAALALFGPQPALARKQRPPTGFEATLPAPPPVPRPADGSIFNVNAGYASLYEGTRARMVGDPLTILLVESTTAAKTVGSKSQKGGGASITPPTAGPLSFLNPDALRASSQSTFDGQGNAAQTSSLSATLSVTIAEVRPNGTALVRGEKRMLLSQGNEWIQFSGIVRLIDVDQQNAIPSSRVADARIEYSGKGALQRASKQGWLGRFFNMISPF